MDEGNRKNMKKQKHEEPGAEKKEIKQPKLSFAVI